MRWIILGMAVALAGCAGLPVAEPEPRVVRVEVPVQVPYRVKAGGTGLGGGWTAEGGQPGGEGPGAAGGASAADRL